MTWFLSWLHFATLFHCILRLSFTLPHRFRSVLLFNKRAKQTKTHTKTQIGSNQSFSCGILSQTMLLFSRTNTIGIALTFALLCVANILVDAQDGDVATASKRSYRSLDERFQAEDRKVLFNSRKLEGSCSTFQVVASITICFLQLSHPLLTLFVCSHF